MRADHEMYSGLGLDRLAAYFSDYAVLSDAFSHVFRPLTVGSSLVVSAHLAGAQFRFDFSPQQSWTYDAEDVWDQLSMAVNAFRGNAQLSSALAPPTIDNGLVAVAASPALRMRGGLSPSSGNADGPAGVHEFVHLIAKFEPWYEPAVSAAPEDLSVIVAVREKSKVRWVTTVPSYCRFETHADDTYLFVRCNLGGIGQAVADGALQVFVVRWAGRRSALRRL